MNQLQTEKETPVSRDTESPIVSDATIVSSEPEHATAPQKKGYVKYVLLGILVAVGIGALYNLYMRPPVDAVAIVNGTNITKTELDENIAMMVKSAQMQGIDTTDATITSEIRTQALENLINNALLVGAAKATGAGPNEAAVQTAYESLVAEVGSEEELKTRMETVGLTTETLYKNITDRLLVDTYIESVTDIKSATVTDEEITTYINSISAEGVTLPPLDEIKPQIEATLLIEKQQKIVDELILKLRTEGEVEIIEAK